MTSDFDAQSVTSELSSLRNEINQLVKSLSTTLPQSNASTSTPNIPVNNKNMKATNAVPKARLCTQDSIITQANALAQLQLEQQTSIDLLPRPLVYLSISSDILHHGHVHIISNARQHGTVVVGLLTDAAIQSYKRDPILPYLCRKTVLENIKGVAMVVPQHSQDFRPNLNLLKPRVMVYFDEWNTGAEHQVRQLLIGELDKWGGFLTEPHFDETVSTSDIIKRCFMEQERKRALVDSGEDS